MIEMVTRLSRRRRTKVGLRRDWPKLSTIIGTCAEGLRRLLLFLLCILCFVQIVEILLSENGIEKILLVLVRVGFSLGCGFILDGIQKNLFDGASLPCFLTVCGILGVFLLMATYANELNNVNSFLFYYTFNTKPTMQYVVQNLTNKAHARLTLLVYIYHFILRFLEIPWQVLIHVLNYANKVCGWFYVNLLQLFVLLHENIPGGIPGIVLSIFVVILLRWLRRLSKAHERCKAENRQLRLSLEEERDKRLCGICQDQTKTILLLPCNHLCLCKQCLDHKEWKECPICREGVQSTLTVYM